MIMDKMEYTFDDFYNEFKDWTKKQILHRTFDIILKDTEEIEEKDKEIERLIAESTEWESKCYKYQDIINELEKDMREKYHKEIDYQSKIMQSDLMQGDYPVSYYYAEQNEKLLNYYLNKLKALKEGKK